MPVDPNSIKRRIIAMKQEHPEMKPGEIAKALGSTRKYANAVLGEMLMTNGYLGEIAKPGIVSARQTGAGNSHRSGFVRLI